MRNRIFKLLVIFLLISACNGKIPGADARKIPPNAKDRVKKNMEEGRGFTLMGSTKKILANLTLLVQMNYGEHL